MSKYRYSSKKVRGKKHVKLYVWNHAKIQKRNIFKHPTAWHALQFTLNFKQIQYRSELYKNIIYGCSKSEIKISDFKFRLTSWCHRFSLDSRSSYFGSFYIGTFTSELVYSRVRINELTNKVLNRNKVSFLLAGSDRNHTFGTSYYDTGIIITYTFL